MPELAITLGALIDESTAVLHHAAIPDPRREALRIWRELTETGLAEPLLARDLEVEAGLREQYRGAIKRRAGGEPTAHVTGWAGFRRLTLRSDRRALIPRPETEGLVELVLERVPSGRVADIGTGSGCIALSLAQEGSYGLVLGTDRSADALALADLNRRLVGARVELLHADLCSALEGSSLDALVSNPPYLTDAEYRELDRSVRDWEPGDALVSGDDGLVATYRVLDEGRRVVRPGGWLALEVDCNRANVVARRASELGWNDVAIHADLFGRERYLLARRSHTP